MKFEKRVVTIKAGNLQSVFEVATTLCEARLPINATVSVYNLRDNLKQYLQVFQDKWNALLSEYSSEGKLGPEDPHWAEWKARAEILMNEPVEAKLPTYLLEDMSAFPVELTGLELEILLNSGIILEKAPGKTAEPKA